MMLFPVSHSLNNYSLYSDRCSLLILISPLPLFFPPNPLFISFSFYFNFSLLPSRPLSLLCPCRSPLMLLCPQYHPLLRKQLRKANWRYCSTVLLCAVRFTDLGAVLCLCCAFSKLHPNLHTFHPK